MQQSLRDRINAAVEALELRATHQDGEVIELLKEVVVVVSTIEDEFTARVEEIEAKMPVIIELEQSLAKAKATIKRIAEALSDYHQGER